LTQIKLSIITVYFGCTYSALWTLLDVAVEMATAAKGIHVKMKQRKGNLLSTKRQVSYM